MVEFKGKIGNFFLKVKSVHFKYHAFFDMFTQLVIGIRHFLFEIFYFEF